MSNIISTQSMPATTFTKKAQEEVYNFLNFDDKQDFEDANRGFIAPLESQIKNAKGRVIWDIANYVANDGPSPDTINPSLWRNVQIHENAGLYKIVEGVYQVRGYSAATIIIIEGEKGVIVCDTNLTVEFAKASMELYFNHRPKKPVTAIIVSQSHKDHWGGIQGILDYAENNNIPIIVPQHFTKEALSENVLLGPIMNRRAEYQLGFILPVNHKQFVSVGLGSYSGTGGYSSFIQPNVEIKNDIESLIVDGISIQFLLTPNTEAPAEMHIYFEDYKVLFPSENTNKGMHQIYTLRGAKTRDALEWSNAIDKTIDLIENKPIEALITAHGWPIWGKERSLEHLKLQRDLYKYMHDQTIRLANHGYTMDEIADEIELPQSLSMYWGNREYYGTLKHNCKGIYNFYLGYYSGHPSDLDPLPQVETGHKYIQYMGGIANVIKQAKADFEKGEYRWVAQVLKHVVMIEPDQTEAKHLLADAYEQLGYQAESANWRNIYLVGASELRTGNNMRVGRSSSVISSMPMEDFFRLLAVRLDGLKAEGKKITINLTLSDEDKDYIIKLENSVLNSKENKIDGNPDVKLTFDKLTFYTIFTGEITPEQAILDGKLISSGNLKKLHELISLLDDFDHSINIVTP